MTEELFREDATLRACAATVLSAAAGGIVLDRTVFYPEGGGQPGDTGMLRWADGETPIIDTRKGDGGIVHVPAEGSPLPPAGATVEAVIDWDRRHRHMRMHTALHLICAIAAAPITGAALTAEKGRIDLDLPDPPDKDALNARLAEIIRADLPVRHDWISDAELDANPALVKTLTVQPPRGQGRVRVVAVEGIDRQPCGGTHVASTGEIGAVAIGKIDKKGKLNRRFSVVFLD
ncbi:alanyl-tRNA editing protein [Novispirillum sp. DQ9]|uniref:alanyl-tRNA editing protein n=1 Tax=Novispirillum sp. DQ9 TaxID=3398612 RepID=UPI003C7CE94C